MGRSTPDARTFALTRLLSAPNRRLAVKPLIRAAWRLRHNLTVGDALYVVAAEHLGAPLVTTDLRLARAPTLGIDDHAVSRGLRPLGGGLDEAA